MTFNLVRGLHHKYVEYKHFIEKIQERLPRIKKAINILENNQTKEAIITATNLFSFEKLGYKEYRHDDIFFCIASSITDYITTDYIDINRMGETKRYIFVSDASTKSDIINKGILQGEVSNILDNINNIPELCKKILYYLAQWYNEYSNRIKEFDGNPIITTFGKDVYRSFNEEAAKKEYCVITGKNYLFRFDDERLSPTEQSAAKYLAFTVIKSRIRYDKIKPNVLDKLLKKALKDLAKARMFYGKCVHTQKKDINIKISEHTLICINKIYFHAVSKKYIFCDKPFFL